MAGGLFTPLAGPKKHLAPRQAVTIPSPDSSNDPKIRSWLPSANRSGCAFPIQNLPFGVFRRAQSAESFRGGVALGDQIIDLRALADTQLFTDDAAAGVSTGSLAALNSRMQLWRRVWAALCCALFES